MNLLSYALSRDAEPAASFPLMGTQWNCYIDQPLVHKAFMGAV